MKRTLAIGFSIAYLSLLLLRPAFACSTTGPDPWFETKIWLDSTTLPKGVHLMRTYTSNISDQYLFINDTDIPFYLLHRSFPLTQHEKTPGEINLPEEYQAKYKVTQTESYNWVATDGEWRTYDEENGLIGIPLNQDYEMPSGSKQIYEDNRPSNITLPAAQSLRIFGYYDSKVYVIEGKMVYTLNTKYDPEAGKKGAAACQQLYWISGVVKTIPVIGLIGLIGVFVHFYKKSKAKKKV